MARPVGLDVATIGAALIVFFTAQLALAQPPPPPLPAAPPPPQPTAEPLPPEPPAAPAAPVAPTPPTVTEVPPTPVAPGEPPTLAPTAPEAPPSTEPTTIIAEPPAADGAATVAPPLPEPTPPTAPEAATGRSANEEVFAGGVAGAEAGAPGESPTFIKGELIHVGTRRLLSRYDHVGVALGVATIANDFFLTLTPGTAFYLDRVSFSLGVPLNLLVVQGGSFDFGSFKIRREDWDEVPDYAKVIRFVTIGRKEDPLYFTLNSLRPVTIGHGMLLNNYQGNIDVDRSMTGATFDAYNKYAGFQFQANDVTLVNKVLGGLAFIKPLSFFSDNVLLQSLSLGGEYVADFNAPRCIRKDSDRTGTCVQGTGHAAGFDPFTGAYLDDTFIRTDPDTGRAGYDKATVHAAGFSGEMKFFKDARNIDLKVYGTYHQFLNEGGGNGLSVGVLGRINAGSSLLSALRVRAEYRNFGEGFLPSYWDSLYEINKYYYPTRSNPYQVTPTKLQAVFGDPENGFARQDRDRRHGYNLEASYGLFSGSRSGKQVAFGFGLQDSTGPDDTQLYAHLEFPLLGWLQLFGTYMKTSEATFGDVFASDMFTAQNAVVLTGARLQILPFMFINAHYSRNFRVVRSPGSEYHLGNDAIVDAAGEPSPYFPEAPLFENVQTFMAELELGWEFDDE